MASVKRKDNKGRILRDGEYQREDGKYEYKYFFAGRRKSVYSWKLVSTDKTPIGKKEDISLREKEKQLERDLQDGIDSSKGNITLNQLFDVYMENKTDLRESTRHNYIGVWNSAIRGSILGNMKITQIKQLHVKSFYAGLVKQGLSANTIKLYHNLIYPAFEMAVDSDIIRKNPAKDARKGVGGSKKERNALTVIEQENLLEFVKNSNRYSIYHPMLTFALYTGLRAGELAGLRWSDVDLKENIIHIRQQLIYKNLGDGCKFYVQPLKTDAGWRDIPLTAKARKSLINQKELDFMLRKVCKSEINGIDDFVFTNTQGNPYAPNAINLFLDNIVRAYNNLEKISAEKERREPQLLPHISAHILRHTACTRFAESGIDPKVLQSIMGHSDIGVTMNVYNHVDGERLVKEMQKLEAII